jgi:hypothetical protein
MKKSWLIALAVLFILSLPLAALSAGRGADDDEEYIEDVLDEWWEEAEDQGYEVIDWAIDEIDDDTYITYTIDLTRGEYVIVAEGGIGIVNLDMAAWYEDEYDDGDDPFVEDTLDDNYPMLEFELRRSETIVVEVWVEEWERRTDEGLFCILFAGDE